MTLLICPVRPGDSNEELRYAMRSWEANLIMPDLRLMTVGHCPDWILPDWHVSGNRFSSVQHAVFDNVLLGAEEATQFNVNEVIFMNDDFFCMDPTPGVVPVRRNMSLADQCKLFPAQAGLWWPRSLALTLSWLQSEGYPHPDSYEAHRPLLVQPDRMVWALSRWIEQGNDPYPDTVPQWRTVYGVLNEVQAYPVKDAKLGTTNNGVGTPWLSTSDQSWRRFAAPMKKRFQKPSRWERQARSDAR